MTKAEARQRAYYKNKLEAWARGEWTPPPGWAQSVVNRFPELVEKYRDEVLGKEAADEAREKHAERVKPKVGDLVVAPPQKVRLRRFGLIGTRPQQERLIVGVDHKRKKIRYAANTWPWRLYVKLRLVIGRLFKGTR